MYWIVVANTNCYRIYTYDHKNYLLAHLAEESDPDAKKRTSELVSDEQGHYQTSQPARGAYSPHTDPKENEILHFLKKLADVLEEGRTNNEFEKIIFIATPQVNGLLTKQLNKHLSNLFLNHIKKDVTQLNQNELNKFIKDHWKVLANDGLL